jgi:hypothetical protein
MHTVFSTVRWQRWNRGCRLVVLLETIEHRHVLYTGAVRPGVLVRREKYGHEREENCEQ